MYLSIRRGDTKFLKFQRKNKDKEVILEQAEKLYFTVKKSFRTKEALFQKTIEDMSFDEDGTYHFVIEPEDTDGLEYGMCKYDVQVEHDGVKSTIAIGDFEIKEEVTFAENEV